jgi:hypothetical protein
MMFGYGCDYLPTVAYISSSSAECVLLLVHPAMSLPQCNVLRLDEACVVQTGVHGRADLVTCLYQARLMSLPSQQQQASNP